MNATNVLTIDSWGDPGVSTGVTAPSVMSMPAMVGARLGASLSPFAFQMGHMGAGLGWHGFVLDSNPSTLLECTR